MKLIEIQIKDFMSMADVSITFEDGIISVLGKNQDVLGATSNGSGKSVLFDAIVWGMYGKTIRPISGDDVIRRGKDIASVSLFFEKAENTYSIERTRGTKATLQLFVSEKGKEPQELTQGIASLTQGKLDEIIGMDYKTFLSVATFDLDALRFARATDKEQKEILERLLNLDIYNIALEKTRKEISTKEKELISVGVARDYAQAAKEELLKEHDDLNVAYEQHEVKKQENKEYNEKSLTSTQEEINKLADTINTYNRLVKEAQSSAIDINNDLVTVKKKNIKDTQSNIDGIELVIRKLQSIPTVYQTDPQLNKKLMDAKAILTSLDLELKNTQRTRKAKELQIELLETKLGQPCKECNRPITENELGGVLESYANDVLKLMEEEALIKSEYVNREIDYNNINEEYALEYQKVIDGMNRGKEVNKQISDNQNTIKTLRQDIADFELEIRIEEQRARKDIQDRIGSYQAFITQSNRTIASYNENIVKIKHAFELLEAKSAQFKQSLEACETKMHANDSKLKQEEDKIGVISTDLGYLKYWERAFSYQGIRAVLLDDVAAKLTENANDYLKQMMGGSLWIDCHTQSTNKDGEKRERFEVQTFNSFGAGTYYGNSKGEQQRIDIALSLALHDIARTRSTSPIGFTIFDEVFERLDDAGCDSIIRLLHHERANFGTVFVVSHNPNLTIRFPKQLEFIKQGGITSLVKKEIICEKSKPELLKTETNTPPIAPEPMKKRSRGRPPKTVIS